MKTFPSLKVTHIGKMLLVRQQSKDKQLYLIDAQCNKERRNIGTSWKSHIALAWFHHQVMCVQAFFDNLSKFREMERINVSFTGTINALSISSLHEPHVVLYRGYYYFKCKKIIHLRKFGSGYIIVHTENILLKMSRPLSLEP
jgi:hypothetical protein